jgi:hypothetical protein
MHDVSRAELVELKWKYEEMLRLRLADLASPGGDPRREMAALAERFPGSLRELDELPLEAITTRVDELSQCIAGGAVTAPWMLASARFHRLMRGALAVKRSLRTHRPGESALGRAVLEKLEGLPHAEDAWAWADDVDRIARPPRGRLTALVFERLADELGISPSEARARVLGPRLRKRPCR